MELNFEDSGEKRSIKKVTIDVIKNRIINLEPNLSPYVIFSLDNDDFIQCAGGIKSLVIEARFYRGDSFKHFIIGKKEMSDVWHTIECKVGPIRVLGHEVLNVDNALELFSHFYFENDILPTYNKRNITKQFA